MILSREYLFIACKIGVLHLKYLHFIFAKYFFIKIPERAQKEF